MALPEQRLNEIATMRLVLYYRENGVMLRPGEVKREIHNMAKKLGVTPQEVAECARFIYSKIFEETMEVVDSIIAEPVKVKK